MSNQGTATVAAVVESTPEVVVESASEITPSEDRIAELAYSYWEARGFVGGSSEEDWYRAERELRSQASE